MSSAVEDYLQVLGDSQIYPPFYTPAGEPAQVRTLVGQMLFRLSHFPSLEYSL